MKKPFVKFNILLLAVLFFTCSSDKISDINDQANTSLETEILLLINDHRASLNLKKLETLAVIKTQTNSHTKYMIKKGKISHDNFNQRANYLQTNAKATSTSENVASGYSSAKSVIKGWLNSTGHRKNIEGNYTHFNITAAQNNKGIWYYTNIFMYQ
ncbi:CAP domain-containing protein [Tenacibaculum halocynthiae]|uniref:CAP domain-containing protein n=1 Tax=Tenacibaculum halocynthiae TaxID=1254437 RepID=UPI0038935303